MDREQIDSWCEKGLFGVILGTLLYLPLAFGGMRALEVTVLQGATVVVLALWTIRTWVRKDYRFLLPPVSIAAVFFVAYAFWRYTEAPIQADARSEILRIICFAVFFFAIIDNLNKQEWVQIICMALLFVGMVISFVAIYQFITGRNAVWGIPQAAIYKGRASGTYFSPNHMAGLLAMLLPFGLAFTFMARVNIILRVLVGYATFMIAAGIAVTFSRGGWLAAGVGVLLLFGYTLRKRQFRIPAALILIALLAAGTVFVRRTFQSQHRMARVHNAWTVRQNLWDGAIKIWQTNFWFGAGPNHYDALFPAHRANEVQYQPLRAHNDYLGTLSDYGVVGLALGSLMVGALFYGVARSWKFVQRSSDLGTRSSTRTAVVLGGTVAVIAILVHATADFNFHVPANGLAAVAFAAFLAGYFRYATEKFWIPMRWFGRIALTLILLGTAAYLTQEGMRLARHEYFVRQARAATPGSSEELALLEKAYAADPIQWRTAYNIGENLRSQSWEGLTGYEALAERAMKYYALASKLNPYDAASYLRYGMCLHWLKRHDEAGKYFEKARELDPNSYILCALYGWHLFQLKDYEGAMKWLQRSFDLTWGWNELAEAYYGETKKMLEETKQLQ